MHIRQLKSRHSSFLSVVVSLIIVVLALIALDGLFGSSVEKNPVYTLHTSTRLNTPELSSPPSRITLSIITTSSAGGHGETVGDQLPMILDNNYAGWKGVESFIKPFSRYMETLTEAGFIGDFFWSFVSSENPLKELASRDDIAVIIATIENIAGIQVEDAYAYVIYEIKIIHVIKNASISDTVSYNIGECSKSGELCEITSNEPGAMRRCSAQIREGHILEVSLTAFISKDAIGKRNLTIKDVASPFPLLNPGNEYLLFLQLATTGIRVYYDFVWGPYTYLVRDGKVYSLNYVEYPVELDPTEFFEDENISWEWGTYSYHDLRRIADQKLKAYAVPSEDFIKNVLD